MAAIITLKDIEEAINNLDYKSETTLKSKLIRAVRNYYPDESSIDTLKSIDAEELVNHIWNTGGDSALIKNKRKNFSAVKSSVNSDLKKLYQEGRNPQGVVISHNNVFDISDEAKNKALSGIADIIRERGIDTSSKIAETLTTLTDILAGATSSTNAEEAREEIGRLKKLVDSLSGKLGLPAKEEDGPNRTIAPEHRDDEAADGTGNKTLAQGVQEGGREVVSKETQNNALADITAILQDGEIDVQDKMNKIMTALQEVLTDAISLAGSELDTEESGQIQKFFSDLSETFRSPLDQKSDTAAGDSPDGLTDIFPEQNPDVQNQTTSIASAVNEMIADALAADGARLNSEDTERIKNLFGNLADKIKSALSADRGLGNIGVESAWGDKRAEGEIAGQIAEEEIEEVIEVIEESDDAQLMTETCGPVEEAEISDTEEFAPDAEIEEIPSDQDEGAETISEELATDEIIEIVEEISSDELSESLADTEIASESASVEIAADDLAIPEEGLTDSGVAETEQYDQLDGATSDNMDYEEIIEVADSGVPPLEMVKDETDDVESVAEEIVTDDTIVEASETSSEDCELVETDADEPETVEIIEETAGVEFEEIIEELIGDEENVSVQEGNTGNTAIDGDLQNQAEILEQLAAAAKALEKIGPDLSNSIYSEEEIKEKAKFLAEEFDRYLSVREKFYHQHILIKSGNYPIGTAGPDKNELPAQIVNLHEFYIGKFPVTNALFEIFVEKTGYITTAEKHGFGLVHIPRMQKVKNALTGRESFIWNNQLQHKKIAGASWYRPSGADSTLHVKRTHPVVQVSLEDACAFAAWTGKRIPTEKEWEAAARTSQGYLYPWGNIWQDDACNLEKSLLGDTTPVDQYVKFANAYEVADTLGNVLEWTLDTWPMPDEREESEETYVVKGASWISDDPVELTDRRPVYKDASSNILGFRCIAI